MSTGLMLAIASAFAAVVLGALACAAALRSWGARWRERFGLELDAGLRESFIHVDTGRLFRMNLLFVGGSAALAAWLAGHGAAALPAMAIAGGLPSASVWWLRRRRTRRLAAQLPDAVMQLAGALRAGASLQHAMAQAARELPAPIGRELELVVREQRLGVGAEAALAGLERRIGLEDATLVVAAMRIARDTGGNLAETLERLADTLRRKAALEGRIQALTAQGRMQGWVMALLPLGVGAALFAIEPQAMRPLVTTWQGGAVCALVLGLEGLGLYVIRKIVDIDV